MRKLPPGVRKENERRFRRENRARLDARITKWRVGKEDRVREYKQRYAEKNREWIREYIRLYSLAFPEKTLVHVKAYQARHPERIKQRNKDARPKTRARMRRRYKDEPKFRLKGLLRGRLYKAIRAADTYKSRPTAKLIGCSIHDLMIYLESKFEVGMSWENYGKVWHVDHIMPCAIFDLTKPEHQKRCFHFSNLQPLFAQDNLSKSGKPITNQFQLL